MDEFVFSNSPNWCRGELVHLTLVSSGCYPFGCSYYPDWIAVRASFGMNGIFLQARDLLPFATYLEENQNRRPPDHLVVS